MRQDLKALQKLGHLAQLKSDLEMRRFSAFRAHVDAAHARIAQAEAQLESLYQHSEAFSVSQMRLVNAMTMEQVRTLDREKDLLVQILPKYEVARQQAVREFGRAEVIKKIHADQKKERLAKAIARL